MENNQLIDNDDKKFLLTEVMKDQIKVTDAQLDKYEAVILYIINNGKNKPKPFKKPTGLPIKVLPKKINLTIYKRKTKIKYGNLYSSRIF